MLGAILAVIALQLAPWGQTEMVDYIRRAPRTAVSAVDPFVGAPPSDVQGQPIRLSLPILMEGAPGGSRLLKWTYDRTAQVLEISVLPNDLKAGVAYMEGGEFIIPTLARLDGFSLSHERRRVGSETQSNAYGASARVELFEEKTLAVADYNPSYERRLPGGVTGFYRFRSQVSPEEARALVDGIQFLIEGEVREIVDGRAVLCGTTFHSATITSPRQVRGEVCVLGAEFTRFAIVTRDGTALAEWTDR